MHLVTIVITKIHNVDQYTNKSRTDAYVSFVWYFIDVCHIQNISNMYILRSLFL
jgi:hypothetical protein